MIRPSGIQVFKPITQGQSVDANTYGLWRLDEASGDLIDSVNGLDLVLAGGGTERVADPLITRWGKSRYFDKSTEYESAVTSAAYQTVFQGDFTVELWIRLSTTWTGGSAVNVGIWLWGNPGPELQADNYISFSIIAATRKLKFVMEHDAGVNSGHTTASAAFSAAAQFDLHHLALVKYMSGADAYAEFYVDGALLDTSAALVNHNGGDNNTFRLGNGEGDGGTEEMFEGLIDDVRLSNVRRTASEIKGSYLRGYHPITV